MGAGGEVNALLRVGGERFDRTGGDGSPTCDDRDLVSEVFGLVEEVGGQEYGDPLITKSVHENRHDASTVVVKPRGGLVEQYEVR